VLDRHGRRGWSPGGSKVGELRNNNGGEHLHAFRLIALRHLFRLGAKPVVASDCTPSTSSAAEQPIVRDSSAARANEHARPPHTERPPHQDDNRAGAAGAARAVWQCLQPCQSRHMLEPAGASARGWGAQVASERRWRTTHRFARADARTSSSADVCPAKPFEYGTRPGKACSPGRSVGKSLERDRAGGGRASERVHPSGPGQHGMGVCHGWSSRPGAL